MDTFIESVKRIRSMIGWEIPLADIHTRMTAEGMTEEDFFLAYQAAMLAVRW